MKKYICILLCLAMLASVLAGCAADDDPSVYVPTGDALAREDEVEETVPEAESLQEFSIAYYPQQSLNPITCTDYTNRALMPLIYQGLFAINRDCEASPVLCKSYTVSEDMLAYEFEIDPLATFSDGTPVTAEDAAATLKQARKGGYYSGRFQHVLNITVTDAGKLRIRMSTPYENLPLLLDIPIVKADEVEAEAPLGSGPYILNGPEGAKVLNRRSNWWCRSDDLLITAQRIPLIACDTIADIRDNFEFSDVGIVCTDPGSDRYVEYRCDYELWDCETGIFVYLGVHEDSDIFKSKEARQALSKGIDRAMLVDTYYRGFAMVAELPASPNSPYYTPVLAQRYAHDAETFQTVMSAYQGRTVKILVNKDDSLRVKVAEEIGRWLSACGLIVEVIARESAEYRYMLRNSEYDLYLGQTKLSANMDLSLFFAENGIMNYGGMSDVTIYNLCLQSLGNQGNFYTLHNAIMEDGYLCPILFRSYAVYAARGLLTDLKPARDNLFSHTIGRTLEDAYQMVSE